MIIANNATFQMYISDYNRQNSRLQTAMGRLSLGSRFTSPGDAPADLGISERFRSQIRNSEEAGRVIQNAMNMLQSTDSWMQEVHNILDRMGELAVGASDGSKSQDDRVNLNLEFQQLKTEVARISEAGKYNGLQINGKTAVSVWDSVLKRIVFSQSDGSDERTLGTDMRAGNTSANGLEFAFENATDGSVGDYLFSDDGKQLIYIAQNDAGTSISARKTVMKLELNSNTLTKVDLAFDGAASATLQPRLVMDDVGRIWVSNPTNATTDAGTEGYDINLLNVTDMTLDAGGVGATNAWGGGATTASAMPEFAVHGDFLYYVDRSGTSLNYVKRSLFDTSSKEVLIANVNTLFDLDNGEAMAISADGQYLAFEEEDAAKLGTMVVVNAFSGQSASLQVGTRTNSIASIEFDANNRVYWTNTGGTADQNAINQATIAFGDVPEISDTRTVRLGNAGHFGAPTSAVAANNMGLSVGGGSPATNYEFQVGPDSGMSQSFTTGDIRLTKLGISTLDVLTLESASEAIKETSQAIDIVANQRAIIGSQVSRLGFVFSANDGYNNNIAQAESRLRDVDFAKESSELVSSQIMSQASISVLSQANLARQAVLGLLSG
ncbi:MAG: flagellin [Chlamydiales bacterium]|jgi:flagellin